MTNAEVYIGDEDLIDQFIGEFNEFACKQDCELGYHYLKEMLVKFFKQERTPTLTADERVILRKLNKEATVTRYDNKLYFHCEGNLFEDDVFSFIKERRRILY